MNVYLTGGIGNQLFQTSLAVRFHFELGAKVTLDCRTLTNRDSGIDFLSLPEGLSIARGNSHSKTFHRLVSRGLIPNNYTEKEVLSYIQNPNPKTFRDSSNFYGYFQSDAYFRNNENSVEALFSNIQILPDAKPYIAIHIRGGDYLLHKKYYQLQSSYYLSAINEAIHDSDIDIRVYTDDPFHAMKIVSEIDEKTNSKYRFALLTAERDPWMTFAGLVNAESLIVANSTFSWWAGWLASRNGKKVIRPSLYYSTNHQPINFYPDSWLRIEVV